MPSHLKQDFEVPCAKMSYRKPPTGPTRYTGSGNRVPINDKPAEGSAGVLWTNAFQVNLSQDLKVYRYKVDVSPPWPNKRIRQHMMKKLLGWVRSSHNVNAASNMSDQLLAIHPIPLSQVTLPHPKKEKMDVERHRLQVSDDKNQTTSPHTGGLLSKETTDFGSAQSQQSQKPVVPGKAPIAVPFIPKKPAKSEPSVSKAKSDEASLHKPKNAEAPETPAEVGDYDFTFLISFWDDKRDGMLPFAPFLTSIRNESAIEHKEEYLAALNLLLRIGPGEREDVLTVGRERLFDTSASAFKDVGSGLQLRTGFFTSFRPVPGRLVLNMNTNRAAFYKPGPLTDLINAWKSSNNVESFDVPGGRSKWNPLLELDQFLRGIVIETTHLKGEIVDGKLEDGKLSEQRRGTITGLARTNAVPTPANSFFDYLPEDAPAGAKAVEISVASYFEKRKLRESSDDSVANSTRPPKDNSRIRWSGITDRKPWHSLSSTGV